MPISAVQHNLRTSDLPLEKLAANPQLSQADKIAGASRQFEAIFLRQILANAQKPTFPSRFNPQSFSSGIYQDMLTTEVADQISRSGAFGFGQVLASQLTRQLNPDQAAPQADPSQTEPSRADLASGGTTL